MLAWIAENAGVGYLLLATAAIAVAARWWMTRNNKYLLGLIPVALLAAGVWLIARTTETDQKRLERIVEQMAQGVREGDAQRIFQHVSKKVKFRDKAFDEFRAYAERHLKSGRAKDVTVSKTSVTHVSRSAGKAKVEFWAHTAEAPAPIRCEADFALEDGVWRMTTLELFIGNTTNTWPIPGG